MNVTDQEGLKMLSGKGVNHIKYPASTGHLADIQSDVVIIIVTVNINDKSDVISSKISGTFMQLDTPFYRCYIDLSCF